MMKYWQGLTPFFMRPFSINSTDNKNGTIEILYKVVGEGTAILKKLQKADKVQILGPLGNSFPLKENFKRIAIIRKV
jgi:dihydroorotate dehydrogenase electron transfer subunit